MPDFCPRLAQYIAIAAISILFVLPNNPLQAQETLVLSRLSGPIQLDGQISEPAWQAIKPLPMTMYVPTFMASPTEQTEIRVAYDDDYLYCSGRLYDSDPTGVRANSLYRDRSSGDDFFGIILDTFNDNESALWFWTTPAGVRGDQAISNDGDSNNESWNTFWDVVTTQNEQGWFAEMRIPFSSLGFQNDLGNAEMGLITYRYIARKNERLVFPAISPERNFWTPSRAQDVVLENVSSQNPIYVTPYSLGGFGQNAQLNNSQTGYHLADDFTNDIGLDIKYSLTSNLTLDGTINTDFAQVEADDEQVNLTRFSLFFPEKRQFFQERSGIFSFNTLAFGSDRLFHSRRIGINNGLAIPIIAGARMVGRLGDWDIGIIDMQTASKQQLPTENFGVLRLRRQVFNPYSHAGGLITSRINDEGGYNVAYGFDSVIRVFDDDYMTVKWAQTFEDDIVKTDRFDFMDSGLFQIQWNRRRNIGFNFFTTFTRSGPDYLPGMGFVTRQDFTELGWYFSYDWLMPESSAFRRLSPLQLFGFVALRNADRTVESALVEYDTDFEWKSGAEIYTDLQIHYEDLTDPLSFPENTVVPAGDYTFFRMEGGYDLPSGGLFRSGFDWALGSFFDGWRLDLEAQPTWNASRFFELSGEYELNVVHFPDRDQGFDAHIVRLRVQAALNTKISLNSFVQFNDADNAISANLRFRINFREGNDLWIVYNEGINTDRNREVPRLPFTESRTLLVKYNHTFGL